MRGHAALSGSLSGLPARIIKASIGARAAPLPARKSWTLSAESRSSALGCAPPHAAHPTIRRCGCSGDCVRSVQCSRAPGSCRRGSLSLIINCMPQPVSCCVVDKTQSLPTACSWRCADPRDDSAGHHDTHRRAFPCCPPPSLPLLTPFEPLSPPASPPSRPPCACANAAAQTISGS